MTAIGSDVRPSSVGVGPPPASVLYGAPDRAGVVPSPDGERIVFIAPVSGTPNVWLADSDGGNAHAVTTEEGRGVGAVEWTGDGTGLLYLQDSGGDENHHLYILDVAIGDTRDLTPFPGVQAQLVGTSRTRPRQVAVAMNLAEPSQHDLYVVDLDTGDHGEPLMRGATRYVVDGDLRPSLAVRLLADGAAELLSGTGHVIDFVPAADTVPLILGQQAASRDGTAAYVLSSSTTQTVALMRYDLSDGSRRVLFADPDFDVAAFATNPSTGSPDMVCIDAERRRWHGLTAPCRERLDLVRHTVDGDLVDIHRTLDDDLWVARVVRDCTSASYITSRREGTPRTLFVERPALTGYELGTTEAFQFTASDGLRIHGYVTYPPDRPRHLLPAVLWVHGGPWARDRWGFDPVVQFLATRGYACVQVNYRGSTGYGKSFLDAGDREWGRAMQRDLVEALAYVARGDVIDLRRVAIAGGSYGGYAALMGLVQDPERYACGIAYCAPSSLLTLLQSFPAYWAPLLAHWHARVGHPERDREELWKWSPLAQIDRLSSPLLLVHGANDPRVLSSESEAVAAAMDRQGVPHVFHIVADEGHGFVRPENNIFLLEEMESFLSRYLSVDAFPGGEAPC